jgi:hypothetical protein
MIKKKGPKKGPTRHPATKAPSPLPGSQGSSPRPKGPAWTEQDLRVALGAWHSRTQSRLQRATRTLEDKLLTLLREAKTRRG